MIKLLQNAKIAIIGGGKFSKAFLELLFSRDFTETRPEVIGVADIDHQAQGMVYAREKGIFTTTEYTRLYEFSNLDLILELTNDDALAEVIKREKPSHVRFIDHFEAATAWDVLKIEKEKKITLHKLKQHKDNFEKIENYFEEFSFNIEKIVYKRANYLQKIERELNENEKTVSQIIEGSTIPTFVINKDHIVTHWNRAIEKLTGYLAEDIVGTNKQWVPFRSKERPIMADVILDKFEEGEIRKYYGAKWRKSVLIEGAYEAEEFFPKLGETGKWCWFTASPIKAPDGTIVGAIETLWDKTEDKRAEEERERHYTEVAGLCSIYTALNTSLDLDQRIKAAIREVKSFLLADDICLFLMERNDKIKLKVHYGISDDLCAEDSKRKGSLLISELAQIEKVTIFEDITKENSINFDFLKKKGLRSLAYVPISAKDWEKIGVIRIGSRNANHFSKDGKNILDLIGNRIGVAINYSVLHGQYIRSEEKYRSLFNNDPNPIFIICSKNLKILDVNRRAEDCYGYSRKELFKMPFLNLGDDEDEEMMTGLNNLSKNQSILFSKKRHYKKGHIPFYVNINVSFAKYHESDVLIAAATDITESVEKEVQLIQASKMTTLGLMAAGMAHEINQPLNVIQVCADIFLKAFKKNQRLNDEDFKLLANDISDNVQRAAGIIKHMRDFARQSDVVRNKIRINDPINDVFKVLGYQLKAHQIELTLDLAEDLPYIMAEHNRLEQVFINLVTNAIDSMDEKSQQSGNLKVTKKLTIQSFVKNGYVIAAFTDTGIGMPKAIMDKIFEPFFTTKEVGRGTGLGVSISYGIVKDYDGDIQIKSEVGVGTTFTLKFPTMEE